MPDVVALAADLLAIDSTTGSEREVADEVSAWLAGRGWTVTQQEVEPGRSNYHLTGSSHGIHAR